MCNDKEGLTSSYSMYLKNPLEREMEILYKILFQHACTHTHVHTHTCTHTLELSFCSGSPLYSGPFGDMAVFSVMYVYHIYVLMQGQSYSSTLLNQILGKELSLPMYDVIKGIRTNYKKGFGECTGDNR